MNVDTLENFQSLSMDEKEDYFMSLGYVWNTDIPVLLLRCSQETKQIFPIAFKHAKDTIDSYTLLHKELDKEDYEFKYSYQGSIIPEELFWETIGPLRSSLWRALYG